MLHSLHHRLDSFLFNILMSMPVASIKAGLRSEDRHATVYPSYVKLYRRCPVCGRGDIVAAMLTENIIEIGSEASNDRQPENEVLNVWGGAVLRRGSRVFLEQDGVKLAFVFRSCSSGTVNGEVAHEGGEFSPITYNLNTFVTAGWHLEGAAHDIAGNPRI